MASDDLPQRERSLVDNQVRFLNSYAILLAHDYGYKEIKVMSEDGVSVGIHWERHPNKLWITLPDITICGLTRELAKMMIKNIVEHLAHPDDRLVMSEEMYQRLFFTLDHIRLWQPIMTHRFYERGYKDCDRLDLSYDAVVNLEGVPQPTLRPVFLVSELLPDNMKYFDVRMSDRIVIFSKRFLDQISDDELDVLMELVIAKLTAGPALFCVPQAERMEQLEDMAFGPVIGSPEIYNDMQDRLNITIDRF